MATEKLSTDLAVGIRIRSMRRVRGYTQEGLAEVVGVNRKEVSRWERGEILPDTSPDGSLDRIVEVLGRSRAFYLLGIDLIPGDREDADGNSDRNDRARREGRD